MLAAKAAQYFLSVGLSVSLLSWDEFSMLIHIYEYGRTGPATCVFFWSKLQIITFECQSYVRGLTWISLKGLTGHLISDENILVYG